MSRISNQLTISYLLQHDVSRHMISILEEQRINDEDLRTIDRDDIEHLFKNEYGFTFSDRKHFWNTIQKFQSIDNKIDVIYAEQQDETPDIYEIIDDEPSNYHLGQHYTPLSSSSSKMFSSATAFHRFESNTTKHMLEENSSENNEDNLHLATTSLPACDLPANHYCQPKSTADFQFRYPVELPIFSSKVIKALLTNNIESEWKTLMKELVQWILTKTFECPKKSEYQAIGQTLYKIYPAISRDGFRPWSHLCKCLTEYLRKERYRRGLPRRNKLSRPKK